TNINQLSSKEPFILEGMIGFNNFVDLFLGIDDIWFKLGCKIE
ncbi:MAG: hypothetical protein K0R34_4180, partial [Herbinix sp.]|nr:hypothetical protein [Herbinix sp.]